MTHIYVGVFCFFLLLGPLMALNVALLNLAGIEIRPWWYPLVLAAVMSAATTMAFANFIVIGYFPAAAAVQP